MLSEKRFYYYKINNDSKHDGLRLEIWYRKSKGKGTAYFVRALPKAEELNECIVNYSNAVIIRDKLYEAVKKSVLQAKIQGDKTYG